MCNACHSALGRWSSALEHAAFSYLDRASLAVELSRSVSLLFLSGQFDSSTRVEMPRLMLLARAFRAMYGDVSSRATPRHLRALVLSSTLIHAL